MVSYINLFLKTEITCIPKILTKYFGDYYNNAICNGATWVFVLWCIVHGSFDKLLEAMLKRLRYREFVRTRLKNSLWYLGFYGTGLVYCGATLFQNDIELFNFKQMHVPSSSNLPTQVILGYTLISTFYLHCAFWEGLVRNSVLNMLKYTTLFLFLLSSYILRIVEISFTFTALISVGQVALEATRCVFMTSTHDTFIAKAFVSCIYIITFATYLSVHLILVPLTFIVPLGLKIMSDYPNMLLIFLFMNLLVWMGTEIYQSVLLKFINHWLYHKEDKEKSESSVETLNELYLPKCDMFLLECSLFIPRDDIAYNIRKLRKEMQERKSKMMAMRKPKNMFYQTLKCMVAVKRKLTEKRLFESLKSDGSEKSDTNPIVNTDENTSDDEVNEIQSKQDESNDALESVDDAIQSVKCENASETHEQVENPHNPYHGPPLHNCSSEIVNVDSAQTCDTLEVEDNCKSNDT